MSDSPNLEKKKHKWAAGGVSSYPLTHPIVGQTKFFNQFQHFIHLVDEESEKFAHVFAIIAQWGIGKSRLAYELMSQINDTSPGWYVRDTSANLAKAQFFRDDADRDQYLGLYIRYAQVATESHNIERHRCIAGEQDRDGSRSTTTNMQEVDRSRTVSDRCDRSWLPALGARVAWHDIDA